MRAYAILFLPTLALVTVSSGAAGDTASSAEPQASASSSAAPAKPLPPPSVKGADIPAERSAVPKPAEWAQAKTISAEGNSRSCTFRVLREWLSVSCKDWYGAGLVAGDAKDVHITAVGDPLQWNPTLEKMETSTVTVILPIERGQARIVNFLDLTGATGDYGPALPGEGPTLHVWWRDGEADPALVLTTAEEE